MIFSREQVHGGLSRCVLCVGLLFTGVLARAGSLADLTVGEVVGVAEGAIVGYRPVSIDSGVYGGAPRVGQVGWGWDITSSAVNLSITTSDASVYETIGFCIDPFHWSTGASIAYEVASLAGGAKLPAVITSDEADQIARLWKHYYKPIYDGMADADREAQYDTNAGLQIIIWGLASQAGDFNAADYFRAYNYSDIAYRVSEMNQWLAGEGSNAPKAHLLALRCLSEEGQDYVIEVPEGGATLLYLFGAFCALLAKRHKTLLLRE